MSGRPPGQLCPRSAVSPRREGDALEYGTNGLLECSTHLFSIDGDHTGSEFDSDRQVMHGLEALVGELEEETGLANA